MAAWKKKKKKTDGDYNSMWRCVSLTFVVLNNVRKVDRHLKSIAEVSTSVSWDLDPLSFLPFLKHHALKGLLHKYSRSPSQSLMTLLGYDHRLPQLSPIFRNSSRGQKLPIHWGYFFTEHATRSFWQDINCATISIQGLIFLSCFIAHTSWSSVHLSTSKNITYLVSRNSENHYFCLKTNKQTEKPSEIAALLSSKDRQEAEAVKGVPYQDGALLLMSYQQVHFQSIFYYTALRAWTREEERVLKSCAGLKDYKKPRNFLFLL